MDIPGTTRRAARPRLVVADGHPMFAEALSLALSLDYEIVGIAFDGTQVKSVVAHEEAECLLVSLLVPGGNGMDLVAAARRLRPKIRIIVVTLLEDRTVADAALAAGADAFVPKIAGLGELRHAIKEVIAGRRYVSPLVPKNTERIGMSAAHPLLANLTPREHEVFLLLGDARSETEIAGLLSLHISTVASHKHNLMQKLGMVTDAALVKLAVLIRAGAAGPG